jgi:hypothetical protein
LLTKRSHIVPVLVLALALPAATALGADGADEPAGPAVADAKPLTVPALQRPIDRFQRFLRVAGDRIESEERAARRRERREAFAELPGGVSMATLESIAACESGGDPTIVSADGSYRGKYQFSFETWAAVGGSGDPAASPEAEQDYRAALLYSQSGSSPWPICG